MDMGIDIDHYPRTITAVCCRNCFTVDIVVFLQHIHCFCKVGGVFEKCASAQLVQVVLPDLLDMLGMNLVQHTFSLDSSVVNISETVSIYRLLTEILTDLNGIAEGIQRDTVLHGFNTVQRTLDAVNDTAQTEQLAVILAAPVLAESHIRDKVRLNEVVVIINELAVSLTVKVKIQLFFVMVGELRTKELVHKVLVALSDLFGNSLRVILARTDIAHWETIHEPRYQTTATEHRIVYHAIKDIGLTGKTDAHVGLFEDYARSGCSVADIGLAVPRFQEQIKVRDIVAVTSAEITEHSGFIGDHQQSAIFFKQVHKGFGSHIVHRYSAEVACRDIAQLCLQLGNILSGDIFLLFKGFQLAL